MDSQQNTVARDRLCGWDLYVAALFKSNPIYKQQVPCLIRSLYHIWQYSNHVYHNGWYSHATDTHLLWWNNNPLSIVVLCGNVLSYKYAWFQNIEYILFNIDDNSGLISNIKGKSPLWFVMRANSLTRLITVSNLDHLNNIKFTIKSINFNQRWLYIDKIIDYNFNFTFQLSFWKDACNFKSIYKDFIWIVERSVNHNNDTPHFINKLNNNVIKSNLQILSPYINPLDHSQSNIISDISIISLDEDTTTTTIAPPLTHSWKSLRSSFISTLYQYVIEYPNNQSISITFLYQYNGLNDLLSNSLLTPPLYSPQNLIMKSNTFTNLLSFYQSMGLIILFHNNNDINLKPFNLLLNHLNSLIKPFLLNPSKKNTKVITIKFKSIISDLIDLIPNITIECIIILLKLSLTNLIQDPSINLNHVQNWFLELDHLNNDNIHEFGLIHLNHKDD